MSVTKGNGSLFSQKCFLWSSLFNTLTFIVRFQAISIFSRNDCISLLIDQAFYFFAASGISHPSTLSLLTEKPWCWKLEWNLKRRSDMLLGLVVFFDHINLRQFRSPLISAGTHPPSSRESQWELCPGISLVGVDYWLTIQSLVYN